MVCKIGYAALDIDGIQHGKYGYTVCKRKIFRGLIEDYSIYSYG